MDYKETTFLISGLSKIPIWYKTSVASSLNNIQNNTVKQLSLYLKHRETPWNTVKQFSLYLKHRETPWNTVTFKKQLVYEVGENFAGEDSLNIS